VHGASTCHGGRRNRLAFGRHYDDIWPPYVGRLCDGAAGVVAVFSFGLLLAEDLLAEVIAVCTMIGIWIIDLEVETCGGLFITFYQQEVPPSRV